MRSGLETGGSNDARDDASVAGTSNVGRTREDQSREDPPMEDGSPPTKRQRLDLNTENDEYRTQYPGHSDAFYSAMKTDQVTFVEDGVLWNRSQHPLYPSGEDEVLDTRSNTVMKVNWHKSRLFFTPRFSVKESQDDNILLAAKAFAEIEDEIHANNAGERGPSEYHPKGRTILPHEDFENVFVDAFFMHLKKGWDMRNPSEVLRWKEATPAVGFIFELNDQLFEDSLMDIFQGDELKINEVAIALSMISPPLIVKSSIAEEFERRRSLSLLLSTITGLELLSSACNYAGVRAIIKNALYLLTRAFKDWHVAKLKLRTEFLSSFSSDNVFYQKLLNATPLCKSLFPAGAMEEVRKAAETRVMGGDQILRMNQAIKKFPNRNRPKPNPRPVFKPRAQQEPKKFFRAPQESTSNPDRRNSSTRGRGKFTRNASSQNKKPDSYPKKHNRKEYNKD